MNTNTKTNAMRLAAILFAVVNILYRVQAYAYAMRMFPVLTEILGGTGRTYAIEFFLTFASGILLILFALGLLKRHGRWLFAGAAVLCGAYGALSLAQKIQYTVYTSYLEPENIRLGCTAILLLLIAICTVCNFKYRKLGRGLAIALLVVQLPALLVGFDLRALLIQWNAVLPFALLLWCAEADGERDKLSAFPQETFSSAAALLALFGGALYAADALRELLELLRYANFPLGSILEMGSNACAAVALILLGMGFLRQNAKRVAVGLALLILSFGRTLELQFVSVRSMVESHVQDPISIFFTVLDLAEILIALGVLVPLLVLTIRKRSYGKLGVWGASGLLLAPILMLVGEMLLHLWLLESPSILTVGTAEARLKPFYLYLPIVLWLFGQTRTNKISAADTVTPSDETVRATE